MKEAVIVSAARTAAGKAPNGTLRGTRPDELAATAIGEALRRAPGLEPAEIDDVILGCAMPEAEQGMNVARIASLRAGIPVQASAVTVNRFCSSGLQAIAYGAERVMCGFASAVVAGGTESMSLVPMGGHKIAPNPTLIATYPDVYLSTGLVAENHARESGISREEQDAFALRSHQRAIAAIDAGRFAEEIVPVTARLVNGGHAVATVTFAADEGPRRDTSAEALAKLRPAFHAAGTVTAGNSSQISDGAAAVIVT
jgi:acetyl-CoA acyltransferase